MSVEPDLQLHDLIIGRDGSLLDRVGDFLENAERARFAIGYFLLAGLAPIAEKKRATLEIIQPRYT